MNKMHDKDHQPQAVVDYNAETKLENVFILEWAHEG